MDELLIGVRAVHFAATAMVVGIFVFTVAVANPSLRSQADAGRALRRRLAMLAGLSLAVAVLSGAVWLLLIAAEIGNEALAESLRSEVAWTVLTQTRFGYVSIARLAIASVLFVFLAAGRWDWVAASAAAAFGGALAWCGHAGASPGLAGDFNVCADAVHLVAAGAWFGGLGPLALLLAAAREANNPAWAQIAAGATARFSTVGLVSVATLFATGIINVLMLVGNVATLMEGDYGRLLMLKIVIFLLMVAVACVNRLYLMPRMAEVGRVRQLQRNCLIEIGLGVAVLLIVAALGTISPMGHAHAH